MTETTKKVPKLRFPGFIDPWEQRKLGEVAQVTMGQSPDGTTYSETPSDYILVQGNADLKDGWVAPRIWTTQKTKTAEAGDLIMSVRAPAGAMGKTAYDVVLGRGVAGIKGNEFLFQTLVKMDGDGYWKKLAAGSTFESINSDAVNNSVISMPQDIEEQRRIGDYLQGIDNLITLHQRKFNQMKEYKQGMLQKLFPKAGEKAPEVRFPDFEGEWEERDMGSLYVERKEPGNDSLHILSVSIHTGISDSEMDDSALGKTVRRSEDKSTYKHVYEGDLVFNMMRAWQGAIGVTRNEGMVSPAYITAIPNEKVFPRFMNVALRRPDIISQINNLSYGVTDFRKRLYWDSFVQVKCMLPSLEEQRAIAGTFEKYDNMIALQALLLEEMKEYKKGLLQQMFV